MNLNIGLKVSKVSAIKIVRKLISTPIIATVEKRTTFFIFTTKIQRPLSQPFAGVGKSATPDGL